MNLKKCPKCRGNIFIEETLDTSYEKCLQCGYERELERVYISRYSILAKDGKKVR